MAGHSKFKNIMHRKGAQDNKRAKLFTKLVREIFIAARQGNPDPNFNSRLRAGINAAKAANMPKDRIEAAVKKATNPQETDNYEEIRYEGYGPGGTALIVEALTDNKNRTASEIRSAFTKCGGSLGESGSVSYMFQRIGMLVYPKSVGSDEEILEAAIETGADDCISDSEMHEVTCEPENLNQVREELEKKLGLPTEAKITWRANNLITLGEEEAFKIIRLVDLLEDSDDVQAVTGNYTIPDEIIDKLDE